MGQPSGRRSLAKKPYALLAGRRGIRRQLVEQGAQLDSSSRLTMLTPKEAARQSWRRTGLVLRSSRRCEETVPLDSRWRWKISRPELAVKRWRCVCAGIYKTFTCKHVGVTILLAFRRILADVSIRQAFWNQKRECSLPRWDGKTIRWRLKRPSAMQAM